MQLLTGTAGSLIHDMTRAAHPESQSSLPPTAACAQVPVLTVAVPVLTTDSLTWSCSGESPARQCLITRGLLPLLAEGSAKWVLWGWLGGRGHCV